MYLRIFMQAVNATLLCHGEIDCLHVREVQKYRDLVGDIPLTDTIKALVKSFFVEG